MTTEPSRPGRPAGSLAGDAAGAFGDIGTFLPLVLGALAVAGMPAAGVLVGFGCAYLLTAAVYRVPIPVQPMKVAATVLVTAAPDAATVASAGLVLGAFFLVAGASGAIRTMADWIPDTVTAGLQIGLGLALAWIALERVLSTPVFGLLLIAVLMAMLALRPRWPIAVILLVIGIAGGYLLGLTPTAPLPPPDPALPPLIMPDGGALLAGTLQIALPQIPLTLTNAILVTAVAAHERYPQSRTVSATRLSLTTGAINLLTAPFGGMPMCHGAGGVAAHFRFGARTGAALLVLAALLLGLGLGWGDSVAELFARVPRAALGVLLLVPAIDLIRSARPLRFAPPHRGLVAAIALGAAWSPGIAFAAGLPFALWLRRRLA